MPGKKQLPFVKFVVEDRFLFILVALLFYLGFSPFLTEFVGFRLLLDILFSIVFISAIYAVSRTKRIGIIVALLVLPEFVLTWTGHYVQAVGLAAQMYALLVYLVIIVIIFRFIIHAERVSRDLIFAAIVVYLLLGVLFSIVYAVLEATVPGSFEFMEGQLKESAYVYIYHSFVTLTTLGYGDMTPLNDRAGALVILEAVAGQLYLTVIIARLVGLHIATAGAGKKR